MILIEDNASHQIYLSDFMGKPIRFLKCKASGDVIVNSEDLAQSLGFESLNDMLLQHEDLANMFLDGLNNGTVKRIDDRD